ncbi:hypothetical protein BWK60_01940 [Flavobacterium covae]|uniref:hypothetical protein n=1 Tax=Flavobacterium covae TaxID=2906076 RepID=UPI000B4CB9BB|nr:hypothetical protein [Flavobacterium covae]OWP87774.1 hypothetical protein BWK60_01940 [Flavobacterium covae]
MFKFFLNFKDSIGLVEITEPFGFDGQTHTVKREDGRDGRDVVLGDEDIRLSFERDFFQFIGKPQFLIDGTQIHHASHGYDFLIEEIETKGWESNIELIVQKDGNNFTIGKIDAFTAKITPYNIEFNIIQHSSRETLKRRKEIYINAFNNKDLDGNTIEPCKTENVLLRAKPLNKTSKWVRSEEVKGVFNSFGYSKNQFMFIFPSLKIKEYNLDTTLVPFTSCFSPDKMNQENEKKISDLATILVAKEKLTNLKIKIKKLKYSVFDSSIPTFSVNKTLRVFWGYSSEYFATKKEFKIFDGTKNYSSKDIDIEFSIPSLEKGEKIGISLIIKDNFSGATSVYTSSTYYYLDIESIEISATSTAIDSVAKGVRFIDLLKHNVLSISSLPLNAPIYDEGSEHYDNFCFNGSLIAQDFKKEFNNKFNELIECVKEQACDYQVNSNNIEILPYSEFYQNKKIASFLENPNSENETTLNRRYFLKLFEFGYRKSSADRNNDIENTQDDVHTKGQFSFPSKDTDGQLIIELPQIRSAFLLEEQRKKIISEKKVAENDDSLFLLKCRKLQTNQRNSFAAILDYSGNKIYSDKTFQWHLLGFKIGDTIIVNKISSVVQRFESNALVVNIDLGKGPGTIEIDYPLTDVSYIMETDEDFAEVSGVANPSRYANLKYHIKRNMKNWYPYLSTSGYFLQNKEITNTLFRINGKLETRLNNESIVLADKSPIATNSIDNYKVLSPFVHKVSYYCDFDKATQLFKDIEQEKGYILAKVNENKIIKGYPVSVNYDWVNEELLMILEEKYELQFVEIAKVSESIFVNNTLCNNLNYRIANNFVSLYKDNAISIARPTNFTKIKLNGQIFTDLVAFQNALNEIIN